MRKKERKKEGRKERKISTILKKREKIQSFRRKKGKKSMK